jgi:hypothetical protein
VYIFIPFIKFGMSLSTYVYSNVNTLLLAHPPPALGGCDGEGWFPSGGDHPRERGGVPDEGTLPDGGGGREGGEERGREEWSLGQAHRVVRILNSS